MMSSESNKLPLIYILGNSHSGSTLMSFILGSHPSIFFVGEIKLPSFLYEQHSDCICGLNWEECPFWGELNPSIWNEQKIWWTNKDRRNFFLSLSFGGTLKIRKSLINSMSNIHGFFDSHIKQMQPETKYVLDSSKSIWFLHGWNQVRNLDVKVIWVRKNFEGNVSSFVKRKFSFLKSTFSVLLNDRLSPKYLSRYQPNYIEITDRSLAEDFEGEMKRIWEYLELPMYQHSQMTRDFHVLNGNIGARDQVINGFDGFKEDHKWKKILSGPQKVFLKGLKMIFKKK